MTSLPVTIQNQSIYVGDCLEVMKGMPDGSIDVAVTSPPYNIGIAYASYGDKLPREQYLAWLQDIAREIKRLLTPDGSLFLNVAGTNTDPWIASDVAQALRDIFILQNNIIWAKSISIGRDTHGHFKPINSERFINHNHESILHFTKVGDVKLDRLSIGVPYMDKSNMERFTGSGRDLRCAGNVWFIPYETVQSAAEKFEHPAGFPPELPRRCILLAGATGKRVLDPFLGAGTTLVAARRLGCTGTGIELDPSYAASAAKRIDGPAERQMDLFGLRLGQHHQIQP